MDLSGLVVLEWLQAHRTPAIEAFFSQVTLGGEGFWLLAMVGTVFWLFGARPAYRMGFALAMGDLLAGTLKNLCGVARPWLRNPAIVPNPDAQYGAFGYSFPSGHTTNTTLLAGGLAAVVRRPWFWLLAIAWIALIGLSRLVLGVHTPLDVLGAILVAAPTIWLMGRLYDWTEDNPTKRWMVLVGAVALAVAAWGLLRLRATAIAAGPHFAQDAYGALWGMLAFFAAWHIEREYIRYNPAKLGAYRLVGLVVGLVVLAVMMQHLRRYVAQYVGMDCSYYLVAIAKPLWIFVGCPLLLKGLEKP